ncbi:DinB family protein [Nocardioides caldifontis]|uniref:DinB family protein n=1 Tax=Nocardioides caldifontis TaxID=2588938 RepID=UPI0011DFEACE|nr:DinB family protein [Nocardioides caldifontis]
MTAPRPPSPRADDALLDDELTQLEAFLEDHREGIAALVDGLTEDEVRRKLVPSLTTVLGLVKHAAYGERTWFQVSLEGRTPAEVGLPEEMDDSFRLDEDDTIASVVADFRAACEESRAVAAGHGLDDVVAHNWRDPLSFRWMLLHLNREHARHLGHGDILREQLLAGRF